MFIHVMEDTLSFPKNPKHIKPVKGEEGETTDKHSINM